MNTQIFPFSLSPMPGSQQFQTASFNRDWILNTSFAAFYRPQMQGQHISAGAAAQTPLIFGLCGKDFCKPGSCDFLLLRLFCCVNFSLWRLPSGRTKNAAGTISCTDRVFYSVVTALIYQDQTFRYSGCRSGSSNRTALIGRRWKTS